MEPFCVECGRTCEDTRGGLCPDCRVRNVTVAAVPPIIDLTVCAHCASLDEGPRWRDAPDDLTLLAGDRAEAALVVAPEVSSLKVLRTVKPRDPRNFDVDLAVSGRVLDAPVAAHVATLVRVKRATCPRCSRIHGGYYEAVVQVRAEGRPLRDVERTLVRRRAAEVIKRLVSTGDRDAFIMKDIDEHGGIDLYLGTSASGRALAKTLADEMGATVKESSTLVGRRDGRDMYRVTFGLRLPRYLAGDVLRSEDEFFLVKAIRGRNVALVRLGDGAPSTVERTRLPTHRVVAQEDFREAVVVSRRGEDLQVLDPETLRTVDLPRPPWLPAGASTVLVARIEEQLVLVGPHA